MLCVALVLTRQVLYKYNIPNKVTQKKPILEKMAMNTFEDLI
jgi:hypothetical protein